MSGYNPLTPTPGRDWWERQDGETAAAHSRFITYRDMPPGARSLKKLAESVRVTEGTLRTQAAAYRWRDRAAAYDAHRADQRREHIADQETKLAKAQIDQALAASHVMARSMRALIDSGTVLPAELLPRWATMIETMNRLATAGADAAAPLGAATGDAAALSEFDGLTTSERQRRAVEMAEGVLRVYQGGKSA